MIDSHLTKRHDRTAQMHGRRGEYKGAYLQTLNALEMSTPTECWSFDEEVGVNQGIWESLSITIKAAYLQDVL